MTAHSRQKPRQATCGTLCRQQPRKPLAKLPSLRHRRSGSTDGRHLLSNPEPLTNHRANLCT
eukprot:9248580-Prorocentrum_lima.AAC.1